MEQVASTVAKGENMKQYLSILRIALLAIVILSSCSSKFTLKDVPIPPGLNPVTNQKSMLVLWNIEQTKVTDGQYRDYTVDGVAYYSCPEGLCSSINSFYESKLPPSGWKPTGVSGTVLYTGEGWTRGNQVIYVAVFSPVITDFSPGSEMIILLLSGPQ